MGLKHCSRDSIKKVKITFICRESILLYFVFVYFNIIFLLCARNIVLCYIKYRQIIA